MDNPTTTLGSSTGDRPEAHIGTLTQDAQNPERSRLWLQVLVAMGLATGIGLWLSPTGGGVLDESIASEVADWCVLPGDIFLNIIQMVVVPLVFVSIVLGVAGGERSDTLKRVGVRLIPYFIGTTVLSVIIGVLVATVIEPGAYVDADVVASMTSAAGDAQVPVNARPMGQQPIAKDISALIPKNLMGAAVETAMLQLVVAALFFGVALRSITRERAIPVLSLFEAIQDVTMKIVGWAMLLAPLAVFGLLCDIMLRIGFSAIQGVAVYIGTVLLGLVLLTVFYFLVVYFLGKRQPWRFLGALRELQLLAFSTSSSAAVMPISLQTATKKLGVRESIASVVVPIGATVNMDGTAMYQVCAALFLTQVYGIDLSGADVVLLAATTVGASIGTPGSPGVGIAIFATIVAGLGVPAGGIALVLGVDRILDMCRTAVNVTGDVTACIVMERMVVADPSPADTG